LHDLDGVRPAFAPSTGAGKAVEMAIGNLPAPGALDLDGLDIAPGAQAA
jgi:hypothetical protein